MSSIPSPAQESSFWLRPSSKVDHYNLWTTPCAIESVNIIHIAIITDGHGLHDVDASTATEPSNSKTARTPSVRPVITS